MQTIHTSTGYGKGSSSGNGGNLPIHVNIDTSGGLSSLLLPAATVVGLIILIILIILVIREYNLQKKKK